MILRVAGRISVVILLHPSESEISFTKVGVFLQHDVEVQIKSGFVTK